MTICASTTQNQVVLKVDRWMCLKSTWFFISAAAVGFCCLFLPSQPQRGAVDLGALGPGISGLALHAPTLRGQALVDLRGHGKESPLHVIRALSARLQEGDLQRCGQLLRVEEGIQRPGRKSGTLNRESS